MSDDLMLKCLIAFILGWLVSRHMGNGFSIGGQRMADAGMSSGIDSGHSLAVHLTQSHN